MLTTQFNTSPIRMATPKLVQSRILSLFSEAKSFCKAEHALRPEVKRLHAELTERYSHKFDNCAG